MTDEVFVTNSGVGIWIIGYFTIRQQYNTSILMKLHQYSDEIMFQKHNT